MNIKTNILQYSKPDIIIDYFLPENFEKPISVIYVRPHTNIVSYEKAIIKGIMPFAKVIYMANLNGKIFINNALILDHYSIEYKFSIYAKNEISKYPEMIEQFEDHFKEDFNKAKIIGAFDAILLLSWNQQKLFDVYVEDKDFLRFYGQTIKKIKEFYIVNYDMPAIIEKYTDKTNIFVIAVLFNNEEYNIEDINQAIAFEIKNDKNAEITDEEKYNKHNLIDKVKRTYHISNNHVKSMFDMLDFIFKSDGNQINFTETPLGRQLLEKGLTEYKLKTIKDYPLCYINCNIGKKLINIINEANCKNFKETIDLFLNIV